MHWDMARIGVVLLAWAVTGCAYGAADAELEAVASQREAPAFVEFGPHVPNEALLPLTFEVHHAGGRCSGFAVGPSEILTAAHCTTGVVRVVVPGRGAVIVEIARSEGDRAWLSLPGPELESWMPARDPYVGETARLVRPLRDDVLEGLVSTVLNAGGYVDVEGRVGDSGAPVVSSDGYAIGVASRGPCDDPGLYCYGRTWFEAVGPATNPNG